MLSHLRSSAYSASPTAQPTRRPLVLALLAGLAVCSSAHADLSDTIHPFVLVSRTHDDNLFRLPDQVAGATTPRGDTITNTAFGASFERPLGRQILSGQIKYSKSAFDRYDELDYNGKDYTAALEWHIGNHLEGHVGGTYAQTLSSFNDFHVIQRNLRVQRREYADGGWRLHPSWRLRAAYSTQKTSYDLPIQQFNNRTEDEANLGVDFLASSNSRVGLQLGRLRGVYPNRRVLAGLPIDDGYTQNDVKANVYWVFSATSQFQMLAGYAKRQHTYYAQRDTSGIKGRGVFTWSMLRKLNMSAAAWREDAAIESNFVNSSLNRGASLDGSWEISPKLQAKAGVRRERRQFNQPLQASTLGNFSDNILSKSVGLSYAPWRQVQVGANAYHESRSGNATGAFRANGISLSASLQF